MGHLPLDHRSGVAQFPAGFHALGGAADTSRRPSDSDVIARASPGDSAERLSPGMRIGPYEITDFLGAGGMGEVYRAHDTNLDRIVALKLLPSELAADPERVRRFEEEARAASALSHPAIVTIYDAGQIGNRAFISMELVGGETLRDILRLGAIPLRRALRLGTQLAEGLANAHEAGLVHRDLKPENIKVSGDGFVKILDFGLAKRLGPAHDGRGWRDADGIRDQSGNRRRDRRLHVSGAGRRRARGLFIGSVLVRRDSVRDVYGPTGLRPSNDGRDDFGGDPRGAGSGRAPEPGAATAGAVDRRALPGKGTDRAVCPDPGPGAGPRQRTRPSQRAVGPAPPNLESAVWGEIDRRYCPCSICRPRRNPRRSPIP